MPLGIDGEGAQMNHDAVVIIAGRPEAVPYMCALGRIVRVGGDAHIAPPYTHANSFYAAGRPKAVPYICPLGDYEQRRCRV